ncbi:Zn-dependent hydrolase [Streptomyces millisiae]|uniref:Zn-dependent hydrolase n=1 Tax=Streptomyces millisiae TaxID=3075542 RepID=A0ABU2LPQ2_9ACTN|nr:Zn-dependent hydrolase [Streptomyces sp. DSM 44918]MDT0319033.1 Zn-dependent hydrolase [Streptomyces sp. DSM 44918]
MTDPTPPVTLTRARTPRSTAAASVAVNGPRLLDRIRRFAAIGRDDQGGINRPGFGEADRAARAHLIEEARQAGLLARTDAAGNVLIRRPDHDHDLRPPRLLLGSHLDTVLNGGELDGAYGVLAALEVLHSLHESAIPTRCDVTVVSFANEEGALFPQPFWGSMALAGRLHALPDDPRDYHGQSLRDALRLAGGDLSDLPSAGWPPGSLDAYLELHIEQGPVLERLGKPIGVVDSVTGRTQLAVEISGSAGHAGTTPMAGRRDPLVGAAHVVLAVRRMAGEEELCRVATVGRLEPSPNSSNTIPERVRLSVDIRDSSARRLAAAEEAFRETLAALARRERLDITVRDAIRTAPVHTDQRLRHAIASSARDLGLGYETLPSGAGHDAQVVADIAPIGMIFVPSIGGVSHVPSERTTPEDLIAGADVLLHTVLRL